MEDDQAINFSGFYKKKSIKWIFSKDQLEIRLFMIANSTPKKITIKFRILVAGSDFEYGLA